MHDVFIYNEEYLWGRMIYRQVIEGMLNCDNTFHKHK
jgi:hypothetical protein